MTADNMQSERLKSTYEDIQNECKTYINSTDLACALDDDKDIDGSIIFDVNMT